MTLEDLVKAVPPSPGTTVIRHAPQGAMVTHSWHAPNGGRDGWWWSISLEGDPLILAFGWTSGDKLARDIEIARAFAATALRAEASS